jgi:biopolymer transport protein ExbD
MNVWKIRREGSPVSSADLTFDQVMQGLLDGKIHPNDEVKGPTDADWLKVEDHPAFAEVAADLHPEPERKIDEETRLDMNALIDVSLVLLIFFILTTSYATLQKVMEAADVSDENAPKSGIKTTVNPEQLDKMIYVQVTYGADKKSHIFIEKNEVDPDKVLTELKRIQKATKKTTLVLEHDDKVPHGDIVDIQDAAGIVHLDKVLLAVPAPRK